MNSSVYAFRGEIDLVFHWMDVAYDTRDSGLTSLLLDSLLTNLHDDPRWEPLLDKMGLPFSSAQPELPLSEPAVTKY